MTLAPLPSVIPPPLVHVHDSRAPAHVGPAFTVHMHECVATHRCRAAGQAQPFESVPPAIRSRLSEADISAEPRREVLSRMTSGPDEVAIGELLAALRKSAGLTQHALGRRIGYSRSTVASAETGHGLPTRLFWHSCDDALSADGSLKRAYGQTVEERASRAREQATRAEMNAAQTVAAWRDRERLADESAVLPAQLAAGQGIDQELIAIYQEKVNLARIVDRRLGAPGSFAELAEQIRQMENLVRYSLDPRTRKALAAVIVDACALAGWQRLDQVDLLGAWDFYSRALAAAGESESVALQAYAAAARAVVLLDMGEAGTAKDMTRQVCASARGRVPRLLDAWLAASHGEMCAAGGSRSESLQAFDQADRFLVSAPTGEALYLVFDSVHLARWRGSSMARLKDCEATDLLSGTLSKLNPTFARAQTALRADLASTLYANGECQAASEHAEHALQLAHQIGSKRLQRRILPLLKGGAANG